CTLPIDIVLAASDGKQFGAHRRNLELYSEGFPPSTLGDSSEAAGASTKAEIAELPERPEVVELVLRYMHNTRQPRLDDLGFDVFEDLAEAVEKYSIYSAMEICRVFMERHMHEHPTEALTYAYKHEYHKLANKAAPYTLDWKLNAAQRALGSAFIGWVSAPSSVNV
ncbi:hypothetical protein AMATHDRAFT_149661, partial [Amanita thiersii Skay4041]